MFDLEYYLKTHGISANTAHMVNELFGSRISLKEAKEGFEEVSGFFTIFMDDSVLFIHPNQGGFQYVYEDPEKAKWGRTEDYPKRVHYVVYNDDNTFHVGTHVITRENKDNDEVGEADIVYMDGNLNGAGKEDDVVVKHFGSKSIKQFFEGVVYPEIGDSTPENHEGFALKGLLEEEEQFKENGILEDNSKKYSFPSRESAIEFFKKVVKDPTMTIVYSLPDEIFEWNDLGSSDNGKKL